MSNLTDSELFSSWKSHVSEDLGKARFTAENNKQSIRDLIEQFRDNGVGIDDARSYQRRTIDFLVTEEGRKGGKSRRTGKSLVGWVDAVKTHYEASIAECYGEFNTVVVTDTVKDYYTSQLTQNNMVKAWVKHKFGVLDEALLLETCKHSTSLNLQMQEELFNSPWSMSGENIPDWAK